MKLFVAVAGLFWMLCGCQVIPKDVLFESDPRILRGTWTGKLEKRCGVNISAVEISPDGQKIYLENNRLSWVIDAATGAILSQFQLPFRADYAVWDNLGQNLRLLYREPTNSTILAVVDSQTGAVLSRVTLPSSFPQFFSGYSPDLKMAAKIDHTTKSATVYDLENKTIIKTINKAVDRISLSQNKNFLAYSEAQGNGSVYLVQLSDGSEQVIPDISLVNGFLTETHLLAWTNTKQGLRKISLSDLTSADLPIPYPLYSPFYSRDGGQLVQTINSTSTIYSLNDGAQLAQLFNTSVYRSGSSLTGVGRWVMPAEFPNCGIRVYEVGTGYISNTALDTFSSQPISFQFVPTYQSTSSYTFTGTVQIGTNPSQNIKGTVFLPRDCIAFPLNEFPSHCEELKNAFSIFDLTHKVALLDEQNKPFLQSTLGGGSYFVVGKNSKKAELVSQGDFQSLYQLSVTPTAP
jgi:hypothetical protein